KRPEERYSSAKELAADVRQWLADEPVEAYPEPWTARSRRWLGRHRTFAAVAAATLLVAGVAFGVATLLLTAANDRERRATGLAGLREQDAVQQRVRRERKKVEAERSAAEADRQRQFARNQARRAYEFSQMGKQVTRDLLGDWRETLKEKSSPQYTVGLTRL